MLKHLSHQKEIELDYQTDNKQLEIYNSKQNNNQEILKTEFELTDKDIIFDIINILQSI